MQITPSRNVKLPLGLTARSGAAEESCSPSAPQKGAAGEEEVRADAQTGKKKVKSLLFAEL